MIFRHSVKHDQITPGVIVGDVVDETQLMPEIKTG